VNATVAGVNVDLSGLTSAPGVGVIRNLNADAVTSYASLGLWDGTEFYPFLECLSGESWPFRLSRVYDRTFGTGTGTIDQDLQLRVKSSTGIIPITIEVFDQ
jgi:hypothetical protein